MATQEIVLTEVEGVAGTRADCCIAVRDRRAQIAAYETEIAALEARLATEQTLLAAAIIEQRPFLVALAEAHAVTPGANDTLDVVEDPPGTYTLVVTSP